MQLYMELHMVGQVLPIDTNSINDSELTAALNSLAAGKAAGGDDIPSNFWKALLSSSSATHELLRLCQACWFKKEIPDDWRVATVVLLYKKGDAQLPENYRPISLLPVGYKVLARILQKRLQHGGVEDRIRSTQYGFRAKCSAVQAISVARRILDAAYASSAPGVMAVMLDWAKAFDRVRADSLIDALRRFGLPGDMLNIISAIYLDRGSFERCNRKVDSPGAAGWNCTRLPSLALPFHFDADSYAP